MKGLPWDKLTLRYRNYHARANTEVLQSVPQAPKRPYSCDSRMERRHTFLVGTRDRVQARRINVLS